jgi:hypothetical protein
MTLARAKTGVPTLPDWRQEFPPEGPTSQDAMSHREGLSGGARGGSYTATSPPQQFRLFENRERGLLLPVGWVAGRNEPRHD